MIKINEIFRLLFIIENSGAKQEQSILNHKAVSTLRVSHGAILTSVHDEEVYAPGSCTQE